MSGRPRPTLAPATRRAIRRVAIGAAILGVALGLQTLVLHLSTDPLADTRVYYDAGTRLNQGLPLYDASATDAFGLYLYPPLLAILFRPLALLPFPLAAALWQVVIVAALVLAVRAIGVREPVVLAIGYLALPILWAMSIGQAEPVITLLLSLATPASIAFAGHIKLVPWLAAIFWIARRDARSLARFTAWVLAIGLLQFAVEPSATLQYLQLTWLRPAFELRNISPYAIHPLLWVAMIVVLAALALRHGRGRFGWTFAVALAVLAYPRLLVYQLMSLLAAFATPPASRAVRRRTR